jgi:hypothetical protein
MSETCRSCDAEVVFVASATSGKSMILDAKPAKGVVLVDLASTLHGMYGLEAEPGQLHAAAKVVDVYTDHHVTCPDAAAWKGKHR